MAAPVNECSEPKRLKLKSDQINDPDDTETLGKFHLKRVLRDDQRSKFVALEATLNGGDGDSESSAVVLLEKEHFSKSQFPRILSKETSLTSILKNDIYSTYHAMPPPEVAGFKSTVIFPASKKHIEKYCDYEAYIISESPQHYNNITLPCLEKSNFSVQWVYNILEKKSEAERIVFEDPDPDKGFVLLPDMKWDGKDIGSLYLVAIVHCMGLKSLRDLTAKHLPLLNNILEKGMKAVCEHYGVAQSQIRAYLHYQPSYYHLHVHFTHLRYDAPGTDALRAHLLESVIDNIQMCPTYYQDKTLMFTVRENQALYRAYRDAKYFD